VSDVLTLTLRELSRFAQPLYEAATDQQARDRLMTSLGWHLEAISNYPINELTKNLGDIAKAMDTLASAARDPPEDLQAAIDVLTNIGASFQSVRKLGELVQQASAPQDVTADLAQLGTELTELLIIEYLWRRHPIALQVLRLLTLVESHVDVDDADVTPLRLDSATGKLYRSPVRRPRIRLDQLEKLIRDPTGTLADEYLGTAGLATVQDAKAAAHRLFGRLGPLAAALGVRARSGATVAQEGGLTGTPADLLERMLELLYVVELADGAAVGIGATVALISQSEGGAGLCIVPIAKGSTTWQSGMWAVEANISGNVGGIVVHRNGAAIQPGKSFQARVALARVPEKSGVPAVVFGSPTGTRVEFGRIAVSGEISVSDTQQDYGLQLDFENGAIVIQGGDGDGFLQKILPPDGLRTEFEFGLGWTKTRGLYFRGGAELEVEIPVQASLGGVINLDSVYLRLGAGAVGGGTSTGTEAATGVTAIVAVTGSLKLGPIGISVQRIGLQADVSLPEQGGNLGPAELTPHLKFPDGLGLVVDAGPVTGGGFISFNAAKGRYAGIVQLRFTEISLTAIGLLDTKLPGGAPGFSFLLIISATFPPIQLGFGFTLNGAGGLAGINRTMITEAIQAGVRTHSVDHILFPDDPIRDAPQIISDLSTIFPPVQGRYVFGPMALIGYGTPTLIEAELGILLELPAPVRLVLLGQIHAYLPAKDPPEARAAEIHMDLVGVVEFSKKTLAIDATLHDSKLAGFDLYGDMALRLSWGDPPAFAFAIGGFHPHFQPPPGFPALRRLTLALGDGGNPRLTMESYLALTSNTVQFGTRAEIYADYGGVSIDGWVNFDVLIIISPLSLLAELSASVTMRRGSFKLATVTLQGTLTGPTPWHLWGQAVFDTLIDVSVPFDIIIGVDREEVLPPLDPWEGPNGLKQALADARNWSATLPPGGFGLVSLTAPTNAQVSAPLLDPLGGATVRERVVPLNRTITKFGEGPVSGPGRYTLSGVAFGSSTKSVPPTTVQEFFAPAQFEEMSDAEKLSRPSFEKMDAGFSLASDAVTVGAACGTDALFDTVVIDTVQVAQGVTGAVLIDPSISTAFPIARRVFTRTVVSNPYRMSSDQLQAALGRSASGLAPVHTSGSEKYAPPPDADLLVELVDEGYLIADVDKLEPETEALAKPTTKGAAYQALQAYLAKPENSNRRGKLEVMPEYELYEVVPP
jgi:hypothetical protein